MKKRWLFVLGLLTLSMAVSGCGKKEETTSTSSSVVSSAAESETEGVSLSEVEVPADYVPPTTLADLTGELDLDKLVTLAEYKGLELTKEVVEVSDADIDASVTDALETFCITKRIFFLPYIQLNSKDRLLYSGIECNLLICKYAFLIFFPDYIDITTKHNWMIIVA